MQYYLETCTCIQVLLFFYYKILYRGTKGNNPCYLSLSYFHISVFRPSDWLLIHLVSNNFLILPPPLYYCSPMIVSTHSSVCTVFKGNLKCLIHSEILSIDRDIYGIILKNSWKWIVQRKLTEVQCSDVSSLTSSDQESQGVNKTLIWGLSMK